MNFIKILGSRNGRPVVVEYRLVTAVAEATEDGKYGVFLLSEPVADSEYALADSQGNFVGVVMSTHPTRAVLVTVDGPEPYPREGLYVWEIEETGVSSDD